MVNINATTPQLKAAKSVVEAYGSRDLKGSGSIFAKNFKFQSFPQTADHREETKGQHFQNYGGVLSSYAKMDTIIHDVIEGPGKVVIHMTAVWSTVDGTATNYDTVLIFSFIEEDGELKVVDIKDFADPEKRDAFHTEASKASAKGVLVA